MEYGLAGAYYVRGCDKRMQPLNLQELGDPVYMFLQDKVGIRGRV